MPRNTYQHPFATPTAAREHPSSGGDLGHHASEGTGVAFGLGAHVSILCFPRNPNPKWGGG